MVLLPKTGASCLEEPPFEPLERLRSRRKPQAWSSGPSWRWLLWRRWEKRKKFEAFL